MLSETEIWLKTMIVVLLGVGWILLICFWQQLKQARLYREQASKDKALIQSLQTQVRKAILHSCALPFNQKYYLVTRAYEDVMTEGRVHPTPGICSVSIDHLPEVRRERVRESLMILDAFGLVRECPSEGTYRLDQSSIDSLWEGARPYLKV